MEFDRRPREEPLSKRQELLNNIYLTSLTFPATDIDIDIKGEVLKEKFSHFFSKGSTTPGFIDQLSVVRDLEKDRVSIFYAKGIYATRVNLKINEITGNADLVGYKVYRKDVHSSMTPYITVSGEPAKPQLHALKSLLTDTEKRMEENPELFKIQAEKVQLTGVQKKMKMGQARILAADLEMLRDIREAKKKKNGNGRKTSGR